MITYVLFIGWINEGCEEDSTEETLWWVRKNESKYGVF